MKRLLTTIIYLLTVVGVATAQTGSTTKATVLSDFVTEKQMKADLLQMLANFSTYMKNDFQDCVAPRTRWPTMSGACVRMPT